MEKQSLEFQEAMAPFVNLGMVHAVPIEIDETVVRAIGDGLQAAFEPKAYPERITGRLLTSVPHQVELAPLEALTEAEFLKTIYLRCGCTDQGAVVKKAIEDNEPVERIEELFDEFLKTLPSNIDAAETTVESLQAYVDQLTDQEFNKLVTERCKGTETGEKIQNAMNAGEPFEEMFADALSDLPSSSDTPLETVQDVKAKAKKAAEAEFLSWVKSRSSTTHQGTIVQEALDANEPISRIQELFADFMRTQILTAKDLKSHARETAKVSQKMTINYIVGRDATGDQQMQSLCMTFGENGLVIDDKNLPVPRSFGMLRTTSYALANDILYGMPVINLPMFCPLACVVMTKDMHRVAVSAYSLVREAVFMWVVHAVAFLGMDPDPETPKKQNNERYVNQIVCITKLLQPVCEDYKRQVIELGEEWNDQVAKAFYIQTVSFTAQLVHLLWKSISYLLCIPDAIDQTLQVSPITSCEALFTERELRQTQEHQNLVMQERLGEDGDDDTRLVAAVFSDFFQTDEQPVCGPAPRIQDGVEAFMKHLIARNSAAPVAWAELTMGQLKAMRTQVLECEGTLWESSYADVLGLL